MDSNYNTDSLRSMAAHWTLAGDNNLLNILQNTHKKIVSKCQEMNTKLDEMVTALDDASINLQNVNNKFMSLSNSQFIESRVYDDDDVAEEVTPVKEVAAQPQPSQSEMVKKSLSILESMHDVVTILRDSDTESDSDDEDIARIVLKPKDMYRERPLPYIIGSEAWKNKWHAGLIAEDSDTDSCTSKPEGHTPEYSESEEDEPMPSNKSDIPVYGKEQVLVREETRPEAEMSPSAMAAELARRLAAQAPPIPEPDEEYSPPQRAVKNVYKPQQPTTGVIFSDEPPPLEEQYSDSGQDDIFAELHTSQPYSKNEGIAKTVADDLFGVRSERSGEDIFNSASNKVSHDVSKSSYGINEKNHSEDRRYSKEEVIDKGSKKPIGGISVFGTSNGADNIGAAILKRNIRKKSTSSEDSDVSEQPLPPMKNIDQTDSVKKQKDILNDLFAKPKIDSKKSKGNTEKSITDRLKNDKINEEKGKEKVDLFSDDIFDDIDDIFSSNIVKMPKSDDKVPKQSIFDDDIDLFADVAPSKVANKTISSDKRGLFDSDDDLFGDKPPKFDKVDKAESQNSVQTSFVNIVDSKNFDNKSGNIFNVASGSVNLIDSKESVNKPIDIFHAASSNISKQINKLETKEVNATVKESTKKIKEPKSIFDSDSDSDIFSSVSTLKEKTHVIPNVTEPVEGNLRTTTFNTDVIDVVKNIPKVDPIARVTQRENTGIKVKEFKSPSLFDEENDDLLTTVPDNGTLEDIKNIETPEKASHNKSKKDNATSTEVTSSPKNSSENASKVVIKSQNNTADKLSDDKTNEYIEEAILNSSKTTTVILDNKTTEATHIVSETESRNIKSTNTDNEKELLFSEESYSIPNKDIVGDTFCEPPDFEKPKEPKKSKNVNALFDDDSDDETLFFKRNDVIDEVPESFSPNVNQDALFGIFHDEPPAIDTNFAATSIPNETKIDTDINLYSPHTILGIKSGLSITNIPETPSPVLSRNDDFTVCKDIFSSIDSENIFTPTKESELPTDAPRVDKGYNNKLLNTPTSHFVSPENKSCMEKDDLFNTTTTYIRSIGKDPSDDNVQEKNIEVIRKTEIPVTDDLFSSLKIPPRLHQKVLPVIPDFDDSDEELFKPSTSIVNRESIVTTPQSDTDLFSPGEDVESKVSGREKINYNSSLEDSKIVNNQEYVPIVSNNEELNFATHKTIMENKIETEENGNSKKIGKLKSMNFNIDVATLLPGASPKKQNKLQTVTDKQNTEQINIETEVNGTKKTEPNLVKSISFEGEPNSDVLDNKLSKERAKIQVKRRPSTRKARKEAVRKSAIDIEDSTDNSSSIDDVPRNRTDLKEKSISEIKNTEIPQTSKQSTDGKQESKVTKIVYILNDEDIFNNKPLTNYQNIDNTKEVKTESLDYTDGIKTIGKVYDNKPIGEPETSNVKKNEANGRKADKSSLFDDPSDEELFNKNKKVIQKPSIFDSDSEEDLFSGKKKKVEKKIENEDLFTGKRKEDEKKIEVKSSLFGDDDYDDQLFAVKNKNTDTKVDFLRPQVSREIKSTEPVFDDPLSLLDENE